MEDRLGGASKGTDALPCMLARQGFCSVTLRAPTQEAVQRLYEEALHFFEESPPRTKLACKVEDAKSFPHVYLAMPVRPLTLTAADCRRHD